MIPQAERLEQRAERPVSSEETEYHWISERVSDCAFLGPLRDQLGSVVEFFVPRSTAQVQRSALDGTWLLRATFQGHAIALVWSDFRVKGGSIGKDISHRFCAFLQALSAFNLPLVIKVSSLGVRFMEGRTVFEPAFSVLPAIDRYRRRNLVITLGHGNVLGIGVLIFGLGHYRLTVREDTFVNLTGPEVCRMVFGSGVKFDDIAAAEHQFRRTDLIHELADDLPGGLERVGELLTAFHGTAAGLNPPCQEDAASDTDDERPAIDRLISGFTDSYVELFRQYDDRLRAYIAVIGGQKFGILANPVGNSNNMIRARSLALFSEALTLFQQLKLPVLSLLDTPGADPRMDGNNLQLIERMLGVAEQIIQYPYGKLGIVVGRAFGGACVLGFPKVFGSQHLFGLEGSTMGIMHEKIINQLLAGSAKLKEQWDEVAQTQAPNLDDLIASGAVDAVIRKTDIRRYVSCFLLEPSRSSKNILRQLSPH